MRISTSKSLLFAAVIGLALFSLSSFPELRLVTASDPGNGDWPMWGGTPDRNMVSSLKGMPTSWDVKTKKNVKWVATLGSQSYGNVVVAGGQVYVGTNNESARDPKQNGDRGVLMCFRESDGEFLWQQANEKLAAGRVNDWPFQGVCSSPLVEGGLLYYVTNRCEVMCLDTQGFRDGKNDGPYKDEKFTGQFDADIIWKFDMMEEVGSQPHNMSNCSPVVYGDLLYICTSNGQDESHVNIPSPKAPAIIAINKKTGKLVWEDNSVGDRILHGQWSSPSVGKIGDVVQVVHGQGDGWLRGYDAMTGKKLWEFDCNPKDSVWPKTRNELISTPVIYDNKVYMATARILNTAKAWDTSTASTQPSEATSLRAEWFGTTIRFADRSRPARFTTACSSIRTSAGSCTVWMRRRARSSGFMTCSPRCGVHRWSWTERCTWVMRMATSLYSRRPERRR